MESYKCGACEVAIGPEGCAIRAKGGAEMLRFPLDVEILPLGAEADPGMPVSFEARDTPRERVWTASYETRAWAKKEVEVSIDGGVLSVRATAYARAGDHSFRVSRVRYGKPFVALPEKLFSPRFDWSRGTVHLGPEQGDELSCQQWFSPPPFFYGLLGGSEWYGAGIVAGKGEWNFVSFAWEGGEAPSFVLDYEGHAGGSASFRTPSLRFDLSGYGDEFAALEAYTGGLAAAGAIDRPARPIPRWWREPMFCGWGEQRLRFRMEHGGSELGSWINAGDYSSESFYRHSLGVLESRGVNPGIVVIDCFWAEESSRARPNPLRWQDMRGFIEEQHGKGRKVLLWYSPVLAEGLPPGACMTVGGRRVAGDPESPEYREIVSAEIRAMISGDDGCLNADGFKIDFTQNIPSERGVFRNYLDTRRNIISERPEDNYPPLGSRDGLVRQSGLAWGCELVRAYIDAVRGPMKRAKEDSLLVTHTANPRLADLVDMLRLNDMDGTSPDVLGIMGARAKIAKACNPRWLIDTDNDLMVNKDMWRRYLALQPSLGNPDTYYATGIAASGEHFDAGDYELLRRVFAGHRERIAGETEGS